MEESMEILYQDKDVVVCRKLPGVLSTDEPGGMPQLLRQQLHTDNVRSVHRLDRVVGGLMVYALRSKAASELSRQIREGEFTKEYLALVEGEPEPQGTLRHFLLRDKLERKTYAVAELTPFAQEAVLHYRVLKRRNGLALVRIRLETGRTHQIRCQFAAAGWPLVGDRKYGGREAENIGLFSCYLGFRQPYSGETLEFEGMPQGAPWDLIQE
jgi:23S rRNA pseudouridine1911/1915/1917 synthase